MKQRTTSSSSSSSHHLGGEGRGYSLGLRLQVCSVCRIFSVCLDLLCGALHPSDTASFRPHIDYSSTNSIQPPPKASRATAMLVGGNWCLRPRDTIQNIVRIPINISSCFFLATNLYYQVTRPTRGIGTTACLQANLPATAWPSPTNSKRMLDSVPSS